MIPLDMEPMLSLSQEEIPKGDKWVYEPKWDGFRTITHRQGDDLKLISRGARPMTRYFPEIVEPLKKVTSQDFVLDGELILIKEGALDFDALQQRIHPAESRVKKLSRETPVSMVAFDLLWLDGKDLRGLPLGERRRQLAKLLKGAKPPVHLTPSTTDPAEALQWFEVFEGAGLDGVIAKELEQKYLPGKRGWVKVKHHRTCDCVVVGFRWSSDKKSLGSLLLGLYDEKKRLHYIGHTSSFSAAERKELLKKLQPLQKDFEWDGKTDSRMPGGQSRWSGGRDTEWQAVEPTLVCEVQFEKLQAGERFRHAARFLRWRPDKKPKQCGFDQIAVVADFSVASIFSK